MFILFDLIFLLYSLLYVPYLVLTKRWHRDYIQRFGVFHADLRARLRRFRNIWIHAVSVGEVTAIEGFIRRLKERWPAYTVVCSVTTKTGYELAQKRLGETACVIFAPLDFSFIVRRFARLIRPKLYIAAETEIWPNLFGRLHKDGVPIAIINGRISDRSFGRYQMIKGLFKTVLDKVNVFAMQSDLDALRIKELGAGTGKVFTVGNIKFDDLPQGKVDLDFSLGQLLWVAGSTHPGEERIVLDVFKKMTGDWRLAIAPRHVERAGEVMRLIKDFGLKAVKLSQLKAGAENDGVIVVDTIGDLRGLYAFASLVFVGKSLCAGGGHNVIEPTFFAKPVIVGPLTANFRDIIACFKAEGALVQVHNAHEFESTVNTLAADGVKRKALGRRARAVIDKNQGASLRALNLIAQWL